MSTFTLEIKPAPELTALIDKLIAALAPKAITYNQQFTSQSPAEQAARMRMQQTATLMSEAPRPTTPAQAAPVAAPTAPASRTPTYFTAPATQQPPAYPFNPQQYRPQPGPAPVNPTPAPRPAAPVTPVAAATTAPTPAGPSTAQPAAVPSNSAPVAVAPGYSIDDLSRAAAQLMDAGKQQQLIALLGQFQVQSLRALPKEQLGAFATALRQMGARI